MKRKKSTAAKAHKAHHPKGAQRRPEDRPRELREMEKLTGTDAETLPEPETGPASNQAGGAVSTRDDGGM